MNRPAPTATRAGLSARGIFAGYPRRLVLSDVTLNLGPGDATAIIGPNGAGKSTLLKVMAGTIRPTQGVIELDGSTLSALGHREVARRIGVVPQRLTAGFGLTAREVVMLGRTPYFGFLGAPNPADRQAVTQAMTETDTVQFGSRPFAELSGGEAQRVVLAMALAQATDYLLLDEPTVHLDLGQQWKFLRHLFELRARRDIGILAVVHDLNLAGTAFTKVALMDEGRIVAFGAASEVMTPDNLARLFKAPVNVWQDESGVHVGLGTTP